MTTGDAILAWFRAHEAEMTARLEELVAHESPSADKPALDALARRLSEIFAAAGARTSIIVNDARGDHLRADIAGVDDAAQPALVLCHFDTVWPAGTLARRPFRVEDGRAWGPGTYDMKSGIVVTEFAFRALAELGLTLPRPVTILFNSDEEVGSLTSRAMIEARARESAYVLVLESPLSGGELKTSRKGVGRFVLEVFGRAVHAGVEPEKGASAVQELAHQVLALHALNDYPHGVSVNVGVVQGGATPNQVAAHARAEIDVRAVTVADAERLECAIKGLEPVTPGTRIEVTGGFTRPPMERTPAIAAIFERAREIGRDVGLSLTETSTGGGSDGNFTGVLGLPTLDGMGPLGDGAHAEHEHVLLESMAPRGALLALLLLRL